MSADNNPTYIGTARKVYRGLLAEGFADICARHLDEFQQCKDYLKNIPSKDARYDVRQSKPGDCFYQHNNVDLCYKYHRRQLLAHCVPEQKKLWETIKLRQSTDYNVTPEFVTKQYLKLLYCVRKPTKSFLGKKLRYPADYGFAYNPEKEYQHIELSPDIPDGSLPTKVSFQRTRSHNEMIPSLSKHSNGDSKTSSTKTEEETESSS